MANYTLQLKLPAPNKAIAKKVADEAQSMIDTFGYDTFLKLVSFIQTHPDFIQVGLGMISSQEINIGDNTNG